MRQTTQQTLPHQQSLPSHAPVQPHSLAPVSHAMGVGQPHASVQQSHPVPFPPAITVPSTPAQLPPSTGPGVGMGMPMGYAAHPFPQGLGGVPQPGVAVPPMLPVQQSHPASAPMSAVIPNSIASGLNGATLSQDFDPLHSDPLQELGHRTGTLTQTLSTKMAQTQQNYFFSAQPSVPRAPFVNGSGVDDFDPRRLVILKNGDE